MNEPLESAYFDWLYSKVADPLTRHPLNKYERFLCELHNIEFVWLLSGDDNRAEDGQELRNEFLAASLMESDEEWYNENCSVLEMLIAFSRRAAFETDDTPEHWFWIMIDNLGLSRMADSRRFDVNRLRDVIDILIWRLYDFNGNGGLFPLKYTSVDQKKTEVWYQFSEYVYENDLV